MSHITTLKTLFRIVIISVITLIAFLFIHTAHAATITVDTTTGAAGVDTFCNLEEAINSFNAGSDQGECVADLTNPYGTDDTIEFGIGVTNDTQVITDADVDYDITSPIIFDGTTQGNASCGTSVDLSDRDLDIQLNGIQLNFQAGAGGSSVTGLSILGTENRDAINVDGLDGFDLTCSNIGIDADGTGANVTRNSVMRVADSDNVTIGSAGLEIGATNIFAGGNSDSNRESILVTNVNDFSVYGNWFGFGVGPDFNEFPASAEYVDIYCPTECDPGTDWSTNVIIQGNEFNGGGVTEKGINVAGIDGLTIEDNTLEGFLEEVMVAEESINADVVGNHIFDSFGGGIMLSVVDEGIVTGNYIGTDEVGMLSRSIATTALIDTPQVGILILQSSNVVVGGDEASDRNIISGNDNGFLASAIAAYISQDVEIIGNYIGVAADGVTFLSNDSTSYGIVTSGDEIVVGGTTEAEANIIQGGVNGVLVLSLPLPGAPSQNNSVLGNSIYNTTGLAIDLAYDSDVDFVADALVGPNPNDAGDTDTGPYVGITASNKLNELLNYPEFTSTETPQGSSTTDIEFILDVPAGDYRIEFFQNSELEDYGPGETFLTYQDITHTGSGEETFTTTLDVTVGDYIAATTTERNLATFSTFGATSEFSASATIQAMVEEVTRRRSSSTKQSKKIAQEAFAEYYAEENVDNNEETSSNNNSPENILDSGTCPAELMVTDNMKQGDRDGQYSAYHNGTVTQVALLQTHINRILAAQYNQAAGPVDGIFGPLTHQGVERLQTALNEILQPNPLLAIDGIVGPFTKDAINNSCGEGTQPTDEGDLDL